MMGKNNNGSVQQVKVILSAVSSINNYQSV